MIDYARLTMRFNVIARKYKSTLSHLFFSAFKSFLSFSKEIKQFYTHYWNFAIRHRDNDKKKKRSFFRLYMIILDSIINNS